MNKLILLILTALILSGCSKQVQTIQGAPGKDGKDGLNGTSCVSQQLAPSNVSGDPAEYGGALIACGSDPAVLISNGAPGAQGVAGTPGTSVVAIQFCPGVTTYPSSFPEFGFKVNGVIYGVYWMSGTAFLGQIPPGSYSSTSANVPCSFTVNADGSISH